MNYMQERILDTGRNYIQTGEDIKYWGKLYIQERILDTRRKYIQTGEDIKLRGYWIQGEHIYRIGYNRIHKDVLVRMNK